MATKVHIEAVQEMLSEKIQKWHIVSEEVQCEL